MASYDLGDEKEGQVNRLWKSALGAGTAASRLSMFTNH